MRKLEPGRLVLASHNQGKVREIRDLLGPYGIEPVSAAELDLPEPEEIGTTFVDNADLKARQAADLAGLPALADDSGLCVEALGNLPGIFSARWAIGADGNFVLTGNGNIVEAQVTAEGETYDEEGLLRLLRLARIGCTEIFAAQEAATRAVTGQ